VLHLSRHLSAFGRFYQGLNAFKRAALVILVALAVSGGVVFIETSDAARARQTIADVTRIARLVRASRPAGELGAGSLSAWRAQSLFGFDTPFVKDGLGLRDAWQAPVAILLAGKNGPITIDFTRVSRGACRQLIARASAIDGILGVATTGAAAEMRAVPVQPDRVAGDCTEPYTFFRFVLRGATPGPSA
jgi:hypothetical protein